MKHTVSWSAVKADGEELGEVIDTELTFRIPVKRWKDVPAAIRRSTYARARARFDTLNDQHHQGTLSKFQVFFNGKKATLRGVA